MSEDRPTTTNDVLANMTTELVRLKYRVAFLYVIAALQGIALILVTLR